MTSTPIPGLSRSDKSGAHNHERLSLWVPDPQLRCDPGLGVEP